MNEQLQEFLQLISQWLGASVSNRSLYVFQSIVQWSAIALSAVTGVRAASRQGMDYFGTLVIAFISCVGSGTLRDVLLGNYPIFWLSTPIYLITILAVGLVGFLTMRKAEKAPALVQQIARPVH